MNQKKKENIQIPGNVASGHHQTSRDERKHKKEYRNKNEDMKTK